MMIKRQIMSALTVLILCLCLTVEAEMDVVLGHWYMDAVKAEEEYYEASKFFKLEVILEENGDAKVITDFQRSEEETITGSWEFEEDGNVIVKTDSLKFHLIVRDEWLAIPINKETTGFLIRKYIPRAEDLTGGWYLKGFRMGNTIMRAGAFGYSMNFEIHEDGTITGKREKDRDFITGETESDMSTIQYKTPVTDEIDGIWVLDETGTLSITTKLHKVKVDQENKRAFLTREEETLRLSVEKDRLEGEMDGFSCVFTREGPATAPAKTKAPGAEAFDGIWVLSMVDLDGALLTAEKYQGMVHHNVKVTIEGNHIIINSDTIIPDVREERRVIGAKTEFKDGVLTAMPGGARENEEELEEPIKFYLTEDGRLFAEIPLILSDTLPMYFERENAE